MSGCLRGRVLGVAFMVVNSVLLLVLVIVCVKKFRVEGQIGHDAEPAGTIAVETALKTLQQSKEGTDVKRVQEDINDWYKQHGNLNKPAAHLVVSEAIKVAEDVPVLDWHDDGIRTFKSGGVQYKNGALTVPLGGYYSIYSTILYQGNGTRELSYGRIIHTVIRQDEGKEMVLLQNLQSTPSIRRGRQAYVSSNLGATFYLEEGSSVYVSSSIPENINLSPTTTYFGLFLS